MDVVKTTSIIFPDLPIRFCNRLDEELQELLHDCPCLQLLDIERCSEERLVRWHLKIPLTPHDDEDIKADIVLSDNVGRTHNTSVTAIHIDVQFPHIYPLNEPKVCLMQRCTKCSMATATCGRCRTISDYRKVLLHPLPLHPKQLLLRQPIEWNRDMRVSHTLIELTNVILYPLFHTVTHCVLLHHHVPVELRALTLSYLTPNPSHMTDDTIRGALWMWTHKRDVANLRYGHISKWDTSHVTNMDYLFEGLTEFNEDIGGWDVSNVTSMRGMFAHTKHFNQPIGRWDVSNVKDMQFMFFQANSFNQVLCSWDSKLPSDAFVSDMFDNTQSCDLKIHGVDCVTTHIPTDMITLRIQSLRLQVIDIRCKLMDTIEDVKAEYCDHTGQNRFALNFIFKGRILADCLTVYECGLHDTSQIVWTPIYGGDRRYDGLEGLKILLSISKQVYTLS